MGELNIIAYYNNDEIIAIYIGYHKKYYYYLRNYIGPL